MTLRSRNNGHPNQTRQERQDGAHSFKEYETRNSSSSTCSFHGISVSLACSLIARTSRSRLFDETQNHLYSRMLLASTCTMFVGSTTKVTTDFLGPKIEQEPTARQKKHQETRSRWMADPYGMGMPTAIHEYIRSHDKEFSRCVV